MNAFVIGYILSHNITKLFFDYTFIFHFFIYFNTCTFFYAKKVWKSKERIEYLLRDFNFLIAAYIFRFTNRTDDELIEMLELNSNVFYILTRTI